MRRWATLLAAGLLMACIEFATVGTAQRPTRFYVSLSIGPSDTIRVEANLDPGSDAEGRPHAVTDDTLRVLGRTLSPAVVNADGTRQYSAELGIHRTVLSIQGIRVEPPLVAGVRSPLRDVRWFAPRRVDPDTIDLSRGADLQLRFVPGVDSTVPTPAIRHWTVDVTGLNGSFGFQSDGALPATIVVPADVLPQPAFDSLLFAGVSETLLWASSPVAGDDDYTAHVSVHFQERWIVRLPPRT